MLGLVPFRKRNSSIENFFDEMENSMLDIFNNNFLSSIHEFRTDISDKGNHYLIEAELPGFDKKDINIEIHDNALSISAERKEIKKEERENLIRSERHYGAYKRTFALDNVNEEGINVEYNNGILSLTLPKLNNETPKKRKIDIN